MKSLLLPVLAVGCHARLQHNLPRIDAVHLAAITEDGTRVEGVASPQAEKSVASTLLDGLAADLAASGPFTAHPDASWSWTLAILDQGLDATYGWTPGAADKGYDALADGDFYLHVASRLRDAKGRLIWKDLTTCRVPILGVFPPESGDWHTLVQDPVRLEAAWQDVAWTCGPWLAAQLRRQGAP